MWAFREAEAKTLALFLGKREVKAVVGDSRRTGGELVVEPIALLGERLVVLDLETSTPERQQAPSNLLHPQPLPGRSPLALAVDLATSLLAEAVHNGLRTASPKPGPAQPCASSSFRIASDPSRYFLATGSIAKSSLSFAIGMPSRKRPWFSAVANEWVCMRSM